MKNLICPSCGTDLHLSDFDNIVSKLRCEKCKSLILIDKFILWGGLKLFFFTISLFFWGSVFSNLYLFNDWSDKFKIFTGSVILGTLIILHILIWLYLQRGEKNLDTNFNPIFPFYKKLLVKTGYKIVETMVSLVMFFVVFLIFKEFGGEFLSELGIVGIIMICLFIATVFRTEEILLKLTSILFIEKITFRVLNGKF